MLEKVAGRVSKERLASAVIRRQKEGFKER